MKKIYFFFLSLFIVSFANATMYNIVPAPGGTAYTPSLVTVVVGDVVQWGNSSTYPCAQVSQATWNANGTTTLTGGFGTKTTAYSMTVTATTGTIYFVCTTKVASNGTKGIVQLASPAGLTNNHYSLKQIIIFPNPSSEKVNVTIPVELENVTAKLYAANGQEVNAVVVSDLRTTTGNFSMEFPPMIAPGVYFLEVASGSERIYKKITITK